MIVKWNTGAEKCELCTPKFKNSESGRTALEVLRSQELEISENRFCVFSGLGGCMYQTMSYDGQS